MPDESKSLDQYTVAVWESYAVSQSLDQYGIAVWESYAVNRSLDQYAVVVWESPVAPVVVVPDITGTVGAPATFDGSGTTGPADTILSWAWTSIPVGSTVAPATPVPYPDNQAATPIDMTDNEALYHLDGTGDDTSGNTRNLTQFNTPTFPAGKIGTNCIEFNGTNQYAQATVPTGTAGTIACWLQLTGTPSISEVFVGLGVNTSSTNGTWRSISWYTGGLSFFGRGGGANDIYGWGGSLAVGRWYHVVITWDAANLVSCYLDGALITAQTKTLLAPASELSLGARLNAGTYYAACKLDEVAVWSRTLSASEIEDIYELQAPLYTPIPLPDNSVSNTFDLSMADNEALYHFESNGNDSSGNARTLTQFNTPTFPTGKVGSNCIEFDGVNQYAEATVPTGTAGTIACWVQLTATPATDAYFVGLGPTDVTGVTGVWRSFAYRSGGFSFFGFGTGTDIVNFFSPVVGKWYHVVITWDSANLVSCYVDGVLITAQTLAPLTTPNGVLGLGARTEGFIFYTACKLDEVAVWSRALTSAEVETVYNYGAGSYAGFGETFTFTPDVVGTYTVEAEATSVWGSDSTTADAVISAPGGSGYNCKGFIGSHRPKTSYVCLK